MCIMWFGITNGMCPKCDFVISINTYQICNNRFWYFNINTPRAGHNRPFIAVDFQCIPQAFQYRFLRIRIHIKTNLLCKIFWRVCNFDIWGIIRTRSTRTNNFSTARIHNNLGRTHCCTTCHRRINSAFISV